MNRPIPGTLLAHPIVLGAAALIAFNTFFLKVHYPGWWSGKLSDFGLCIFLPIWLYALSEWLHFAARKIRKYPWRPTKSRAPAIICCAVAGAYFTALQLWPPFADFHIQWLGLLQPRWNFAVTPDATDLIALPFLAIPYTLIRRRSTH